MKFILVFGPQAVGKMTVGQQLERNTGLKLFHNHMTIELLAPLFQFNEEMWRLVDLFRKEIFESISKSDAKGIIFTYVWAFDMQSDWNFIREVCDIFESKGGTVYFVELEADLNERIDRNKTPNRLQHKPTKRNVEWSEQELKETMNKHRLNSKTGEIQRENYVRINNTNLSAEEVAQLIQEKFQLY
ncbi:MULTISPECIES: AAA family ATPase [Bacillaceae]|uniref:AAA family ATPase n=1 Tax=Bacillaceae TaxID=186817 RepID=UPI0010488ECB|nr:MULTISPECIES: AAA family ATPase [Bacillaceae]MDT2046818.1 AAA family ATPase [Priestia flexa]TDB49495.1 shikimate kinase [Bacillus sp. CBEL-1]USY57041.1 AAA family ATPase [Bacillus sp. 1780r2a1]